MNNKGTAIRNEPLVSIIVPVYKVEQYLDECMQSIVNQTYHNLEIIVVDDGSPDSCPKKCEEWAARDSRIHVVHKENGGLSSARNAGMQTMHGRYVSFVDSDDIIESDMIEIMVDDIRQQHASIVVCGSTTVGEDGATYLKHRILQSRKYNPEEAVKELLYGTENIPNTAWGKLYDVSLFTGGDSLRYPDGLNSEDYYFNAIAYWRSACVYVDSRRKYRYRVRPESICTSVGFSSHSFDKIKIAHLTNEQLRREGYDDFAALNYHCAYRCFDVLFTLLQMRVDKKIVKKISKKLIIYSKAIYSNPEIAFLVKMKYWLIGHFPVEYYTFNKIFNTIVK